MSLRYRFWNGQRMGVLISILAWFSTIVGGMTFKIFQLPWRTGMVIGLGLWALLTVTGITIYLIITSYKE